MPQGLEAVPDQEQAFRACITNPTLRRMIYKCRRQQGKLEIEQYYRQWRWAIRNSREHYARMVANGWAHSDPEVQLARMWEQDRSWGFC